MCKLEIIEDNKNKVIIERDIIRYILTICDNDNSDINKLLNTTQDSLRYDSNNKNSNTILTKLISNNKNIINSDNQYYYLINISKKLMRIPLDIFSIDILKKLVVVHNSLQNLSILLIIIKKRILYYTYLQQSLLKKCIYINVNKYIFNPEHLLKIN